MARNTDPGEVGQILHNIRQKLLTVELPVTGWVSLGGREFLISGGM